MKKTLTLACFVTLCALRLSSAPVNAILGDESFKFYFGKYPAQRTEESLRIATHLRYVEWYLRSVPVTHLSTEKIQSRNQMLDLLHQYREAGDFPSNFDFPGERRPCFIDRNKNICAVGYLIEQTAGRALAEKINATHQYEYITNMQSIPELQYWIEQSGLTLLECAMIQPSYADSDDGRIEVAEIKGSRDSLISYLRDNILLPDDLFFNGPLIIKVNFTVTDVGRVAKVRLSPEFPEKINENIVKQIKKLRFKPAYQFHYLREEERYITKNIFSKERMFLVIHHGADKNHFIRTRMDVMDPGHESYFGEGVMRHLIEVYNNGQEAQDTIQLKGVITDFESTYLTSVNIYATDQNGSESVQMQNVPLRENKFDVKLTNRNYSALKVEILDNRGEVNYTMTDIKPLSQTLVMTLDDIRNNKEICGGGCHETFPNTRKAWYMPILVEQH
jgi:hypothetical protein